MANEPEVRKMVHRFLTPEVMQQIEDAINKFKSGLEIWWDACIDIMPQMVAGPNGEAVPHPNGLQQPVIRVALGARGILLGTENMVYAFMMTDSIPNQANLERGIMQQIQKLQEQRAAQMNGPSSAFGRKSQ